MLLKLMLHILKLYMNNNTLLKIFLVISTIGLAVSAYLAIVYSSPAPIVCTTTGIFSGCEDVRQSAYANMFGISTPVVGVLYFSFLILYVAFKSRFKKLLSNDYYSLLLVLCVFSFLFEGFLTYVQINQIKVLCMWCLVVEIVVAMQLVLAYLLYRNSTKV